MVTEMFIYPLFIPAHALYLDWESFGSFPVCYFQHLTLNTARNATFWVNFLNVLPSKLESSLEHLMRVFILNISKNMSKNMVYKTLVQWRPDQSTAQRRREKRNRGGLKKWRNQVSSSHPSPKQMLFKVEYEGGVSVHMYSKGETQFLLLIFLCRKKLPGKNQFI